MVRHRPVNFVCKKAVIFLYSIFTASDLKKGFYLLPIVNLLDSYKVYHKVGPPPPSVEESREIGFSCHVFCDGALLLVFMRSHTPPVCPSCIHPPLLSPLSLSLHL